MKLTPKRINAIVTRYHEILDMAKQFIYEYDDGNRRSAHNVKINSDGNISYEKNTACHCHPEYETFSVPSEEFVEWITGKQNKENK